MNTSEGRSDLDPEAVDTTTTDVNEVATATDAAPAAQGTAPIPGFSPLGNWDPNNPPPQ